MLPLNDRAGSRRRQRALRCLLWLGLLGLAAGIWTLLSWPWSLLGLAFGLAVITFGHRLMYREGGVPALIYHSVSAKPDWLPWADNISVTPRTFESHLAMLKRHGVTVLRTADFVALRKQGKPLPPRAVMLHFDDGYLDNWVAALPLLKRYDAPATIFVSLDFIEPDGETRPSLEDADAGRCTHDQLEWAGYMNWAELRAIECGGLVDVQAHGIDHGRVYVGPRQVDRLDQGNWRRLAWVQWREIRGAKWNWHRWPAPPHVPLGTPIHENRSALAQRNWSPSGYETKNAYERRVREALQLCRRKLSEALAKDVTIFCWPFNEWSETSCALALKAGFHATTAGLGENREADDYTRIGRIHVFDNALGWRWPAIEGLALLAHIRLFQGNYYWYFPVFLMMRTRTAARWLRSVLAVER